ncbi:MAG: class I SAM-dependent methyltransferase [Planctomycetales bacterium]|nr:class I SAM-dependent methyltransferase [Planctomycetales bacterium]
MFRRFLRAIGNPPIEVRLWDDSLVSTTRDKPIGCIVLADRATLWKLAFDPLLQFGEAYADGRIKVEGDLPQVLSVIFRIMNRIRKSPTLSGRVARIFTPRRGSDQQAALENVHHHYDLGNDFYQLWLDDRMVYTCAYFERPEMTLEQAQVAKLDHVCRKLWLRPGETVVEAGCGWGALAIHMAQHYGVRVRACNISREQIAWAREQARRAGLRDRVEFIEDDWRNLRGEYDVFASVGMLEHVGFDNYTQLGELASGLLTPQGRGLIHTIGQNFPQPMNAWIERRIFPGAQIPSISQMMDAFEPNDLSVLDIENLRLHYRKTLEHWLRRFDEVQDTVRDTFDDRFVRTWRLYLAGSIAAFDSGCMQLFQVAFAKAESNEIPWTRAHQYSPVHAELDPGYSI